MDISRLKKFAQFARRSLIEQVQTKLKLVLAEDSLARRESPKAVKELENKKQELGEEQLLEQVAYTWFNRFCALRFMDANQYNRIMVVSPVAGQFQPEILAEAKAGHLDDSIFNEKARDEINGLLNSSIPSRDGQSEAYRLMIVAVCNDYHRLMPYLFERIEDYTELLIPDDLLSGNSILAYTREAMTPENCESVESIGWLYQFYISEKKDQVFEGLKKNKKITPENIPAATQLFTPHWIVRYLVENSLGRLWMLNNPNSKVIEQMDYYIKPTEEEKDYLKVSSPEELKICDPACGSGHMLTYAYDLLYAIYLDAGYDSSEIPEKILTNNLYGIEIDERAAELAAFALSMKALKGNPLDESNNRRRFFRNPIEPKICHIQNVSFSEVELDEYFEFVGIDLFTNDLRATLKEFEEADNFGSLIQPTLKNPADVLAMLDSKDVSGQLFLAETHQSVLKALKQADYLSQKYHVIAANPPYMGGKSMHPRTTVWLSKNYPASKSDLMTAFMDRSMTLSVDGGFWAMINIPSWMFLSSYEKLRTKILNHNTICSLLHLGRGIFGSDFGTTAFVMKNSEAKINSHGIYRRLFDEHVKVRSPETIKQLFLNESYNKFILSQSLLNDIAGKPIAYWVSDAVRNSFIDGTPFGDVSKPRQGLATGCNDIFLRNWHEVSFKSIGFSLNSRTDAIKSKLRWFPYNKGGEWRKWYGNNEYVVDWEKDGERIRNFTDSNGKVRSRPQNTEYYFKRGITWSDITTKSFAARYSPAGFIFDVKGSSGFPKDSELNLVISLMNSRLMHGFMQILNPSPTFQVGDMARVPFIEVGTDVSRKLSVNSDRLISISKSDWDSYELSWDFSIDPLFSLAKNESLLSAAYNILQANYRNIVEDTKKIEAENNELLVKVYGFENELRDKILPEDSEITLFKNPVYRFPENARTTYSSEELDQLMCRSTVTNFISYSVGCMFGRYSLNKEGLVLSNQGETLQEYLQQIPQPIFEPDLDNVLPIIDFDGDWFEDDITERFKNFLKVTFGEEHFSENLGFIEDAIGKDIKKYFTKDFYTEHVKRYKKRPIYWMFSSPKGSFNALIYMHRYNKDTVDVVLNNYLREFRTKLLARKESLEQIEISASASQKDKTQAIKTITKINKVLDEINDYEHDVLYPLAGEKVEIDLDDGVKHNYPLFGKALKKVPGLS